MYGFGYRYFKRNDFPPGAPPPVLTDIDYTITTDTPSLTEGNSGTQQVVFTVARTGAIQDASSVDFAFSGTASNTTDYNNIGGTSGATGVTGTINFLTGETSKTITLDVLGDTDVESDETIIITISNGTAAGVATISSPSATTTIANDDVVVSNDIDYTIATDTVSLSEGDSGTQPVVFTVSRTGATSFASSVDYAFSGTASNTIDYNNIGGTSGAVGTSGTINFLSGELSKTITLDVLGDVDIETDETIIVSLSNATAPDIATISVSSATTTITNDDAGFAWTDTDAENYYNSLTAANGGSEVDASTLYSITQDQLKGGIQDYFIAAKASGYYAGGIHWYPFIGGTAATHAVNAITAASVLTYGGSAAPTHSALGFVTNAAQQQFADINNDFRNEIAGGFNWSMAVKTNASNSAISMGSRDLAAEGAAIRRFNNTLSGYCNDGQFQLGAVPTTFDHMVNISRRGQADASLYVDGVESSTLTNNAVASSLPTNSSTKINAWDNNGTNLNHVTGNTTMAWIGEGMTSSQVSDQVSHQNTLDTLLGR